MKTTIVPIEGGLGAQIFGVMLTEYLKTSNPPLKVIADLRYFEQMPSQVREGELGTSIFGWALDYYGIDKKNYRESFLPTQSLLGRFFPGSRAVRLLDGSETRSKLLLAAIQSRDWGNFFRISSEHVLLAKDYLANSKSVVVHVRRGDFLNVASHVVPDRDILYLLKRLINFGIDKIFFLSDSELDIDFYSCQLPNNVTIHSIIGQDIYFSHALMRLCRCLVTCNSQYSLSAAVLNEAGAVIMPEKWFGSSHEKLHFYVHRLCSWMIKD